MRDIQLLVLTALAAEPMHGHRIRSDIEELSGRPVGPGTLYGAIGRLEADGLIEPLPPIARRKPYRITPTGRRQLTDAILERRALVEVAEQRLGGLAWTG